MGQARKDPVTSATAFLVVDETTGAVMQATGAEVEAFALPGLATPSADGLMSAADKAKVDGISAGTWSPSYSSLTGFTGTPATGYATFQRNGGLVVARVRVSMTRAAGTSKSFRMTLPIARANFASNEDAHGHGVANLTTASANLRVVAVAGTQLLQVSLDDSGTSGSLFMHFTAEYPL
jgi:hypothetical protein